jgi:MFS family permease
LKLIGFDDILIGIILSITLINSIIFTLFASFYADRIGRKNTLLLYTVMMSISGVIFFVTENPLALIIAALIGTLNITGSETSAFLSIDNQTLQKNYNLLLTVVDTYTYKIDLDNVHLLYRF